MSGFRKVGSPTSEASLGIVTPPAPTPTTSGADDKSQQPKPAKNVSQDR